MLRKYLLISLVFACLAAQAQVDLSYYLPEKIAFNEKIPTPKSIIGHEVGEFHISHDRLVSYMYALDAASDRITIEVTGYTHEMRPLLLLTITSPSNHQRITQIKEEHVKLTDPLKSGTLNTAAMPVVFYVGGSIHGNEPSGANAMMLFAYYVAAAQGEEIEKILSNTVILLDPCYNPDGLQRFSTWVNSRKSKVISSDANDMEHNEPWPSGRMNHYWFDLNRDWLVAQQPESQARIKKFHEWMPNLLTDHHEMSTNSTFFFQPGVPSRNHPLTPLKNMELTRKLGQYHAKALDEIGSLYYTQEGFDDFYYGKGSTFPDIQGAVGILFEQASSRGHAQQSSNGILKFPFTIRNQFTTALSSLRGVSEMREEFLNYQRQFFKDATSEAAKDPVKALIVGSPSDRGRAQLLAEILGRHKIEVLALKQTQSINGKTFGNESSFIVALNQSQYRLIKSMFEKRTSFSDSLFYDISSWTLSLATGLAIEELKALPASDGNFKFETVREGKRIGGKSDYAYVFETSGYYAPRAINRLQQQGIRVKVATSPFFQSGGKKFPVGSIVIPLGIQEKAPAVIESLIDEIVVKDGIDVHSFSTGLDYEGASLGSPSFITLRKPEVAILVDGGVSPYEAGEMWHLLDTRYSMPVTMMPINVLNNNSTSLSKYNTIVLPPGNYSQVSESAKEKIKRWTNEGGVLIGFENALTWLQGAGLGKFEMKKGINRDSLKIRPYRFIEEYAGAQETSGAIFETTADLTHPLLFGYDNASLPVFKSTNLYMNKSPKPFANPILYKPNPLLSGYISKENYSRMKDASFVGIAAVGRGRVIGFTENLCFRAFWFGTNKIFTNAIFYGNVIDERSSR